MNQVTLVGRFVKKPEVTNMESGRMKATFVLAVPRPFKSADGREADFIYCVAWGKIVPPIETYCHKGMLVSVVGRIQTRSYETERGERRYVTEVVVQHVQFLSKKQTSTDQTNENWIVEDPLIEEVEVDQLVW